MANSSLEEVLHQLLGEICCVTNAIEKGKKGTVRIWGADIPARSHQTKNKIHKGQWVRVTAHTKQTLKVTPLNIWLGSCGC